TTDPEQRAPYRLAPQGNRCRGALMGQATPPRLRRFTPVKTASQQNPPRSATPKEGSPRATRADPDGRDVPSRLNTFRLSVMLSRSASGAKSAQKHWSRLLRATRRPVRGSR